MLFLNGYVAMFFITLQFSMLPTLPHVTTWWVHTDTTMTVSPILKIVDIEEQEEVCEPDLNDENNSDISDHDRTTA